MNLIITCHIRDTINEVSTAYNVKDASCVVFPPIPIAEYPVNSSLNIFLIHNISIEIRDILINQCIWLSANLTFEARSFME